MPSPTDQRKLLAFFGALCLFFAAVEYLFPKPVPFFRLGLSNLPLLIALDFMTFRQLALLVAIKVLGQGLLNGTLASYVFLFSAAGSLASLLVMVPLHRILKDRISLVGLGLFGALGSNLVQVWLSVTFIFGPAAGVLAPIMLGLGTGTGLAVGLLAQHFKNHSRWLPGILPLQAKTAAPRVPHG